MERCKEKCQREREQGQRRGELRKRSVERSLEQSKCGGVGSCKFGIRKNQRRVVSPEERIKSKGESEGIGGRKWRGTAVRGRHCNIEEHRRAGCEEALPTLFGVVCKLGQKSFVLCLDH